MYRPKTKNLFLFLDDKVIIASSNYLHKQKRGEFSSMIHRIYQTPMSKEDFKSEINTLRCLVKSNGHNPNILFSES